METTRHFVATVYVVNEGAVALHEHDKLGMWLPAGGHVDRDELPHEAAVREAREELGLDVDLLTDRGDVESETVASIPEPRHFLLEDINVHENGEVGHQHVDFVFYGESESRDIAPGPGEQPEDDWTWFTPADLEARRDELPEDVVEVGKLAVEAISGC